MDSAELDFLLRREFGDWDDSVDEPEVKGYGSFGNFQLVGNGAVTNEFCGKYMKLKGCLRVDLHNLITLKGENLKGKVFVRKVHHFCNKPSCSVCYKHGWAVRQAGNIEMRLAEASKHFGLVEHIVASVPARDYGLSYEALRCKVDNILAVRGVVGGVKIFHGFRYDLRRQWYWSPHFHVLGFVLGGYSRCRHCHRKWNCLGGCGEFDDRSYQNFLKDGYVVKVLGERKTVFGTAWYQLNHATIDVTKKRFHVATWFGVCSYRKLKVTAEYKKAVCPLCQHDLVDICYHGVKRFVMDTSSPDYKRDSFEDFLEDGFPAWSEREPKGYG